MTSIRNELSSAKMDLAATLIGLGALVVLGTSAYAAEPHTHLSISHSTNASCSGYVPTGTVAGMAAMPNGGGYWITDNVGLVVLRRRPESRIHCSPSGPAHRRHGCEAQRRRLLAGGVRRRDLRLRCTVLRIDGSDTPQQTSRRNVHYSGWRGVLAGRRRRRDLLVRQCRIPGFDRLDRSEQADRRNGI